MRCSLKDGLVILLVLSFTSFEGKGRALILHKNSISDRCINFNDLFSMSRVEQSLDSFPKLGDYDKNSHKIVKKQMTASGYKHIQRKRSVFHLQENPNRGDDLKCECREKTEEGMVDSESNNDRKEKEPGIPALKMQRDFGREKKFFKTKSTKGDTLFRRGVFSKKRKHKKFHTHESQRTQEKETLNALKLDSGVTKQTEAENVEEQNQNAKEKAVEKISENTSESGNKDAKEKVAEEITEKGKVTVAKEENKKEKEKCVEDVSEKGKEKCAEDVSEKGKEKCVEDVSEKGKEKCVEVSEKGKEKCVEDVSGKGKEKCVEDVSEKGKEKCVEVSEKGKEKCVEDVSGKGKEKCVADVSKKAEEKVVTNLSENSSEIEIKRVENTKGTQQKNALESTKDVMVKSGLVKTKATGKKNASENIKDEKIKSEPEKTKASQEKNALENTKDVKTENVQEKTKAWQEKNALENTKGVKIKSEPEKTEEEENQNASGDAKAAENEKALEKNTKTKAEENQNDHGASFKINSGLDRSLMEEQYKYLKSMVGCKVNKYFRFPDVQDNHNYFESETDKNGCMKLVHKICPNGEVFSSRFLECVKPFFWKLVEREKRSLWKKEKNQNCNNREDIQSPNAWTDVTREEGRQFPSELRSRYKPKLVVYHLKVKKSINEDFQKGKKKQRRILRTPILSHSELSRKMPQKASNVKSRHHQLFPRSFIIRINKKGGKSDHEEKVSEDDSEESKYNGDDEENDEEEEEEEEEEEDGEEIKEETGEEDEDAEYDDEEKPTEKSGIKEFFKSAKEAITNRAKFNEPADTSFTLDKTNAYNKNKKLDGSVKDSKKVLIDADIKVDKALGKTLKRILGKRRDKDDGNVPLNGNLLGNQGEQNLMESEQITMYENLIRSNPRLKRYILVSFDETKN